MPLQEKSLKRLKIHLKEEHNLSPISIYLKEIVYGGNDGIITTFAVVSGFSGAHTIISSSIPAFTVLLFGLANLFSDGVSMGLGNFISLRSEKDQYASEKAKESKEIDTNPDQEVKETMMILTAKGFNNEDAEKITSLYSKNPEYWTEFMMKYELELPNPENENPYLTAFATFFSFIVFGLIPLLPFIFLKTTQNITFLISIATTFVAILLLGLLRWYVTRHKIIRSVGEILIVGIIASSIAYFIGTLFR